MTLESFRLHILQCSDAFEVLNALNCFCNMPEFAFWLGFLQVMMRFYRTFFYICIQSLWEMRYYLKLELRQILKTRPITCSVFTWSIWRRWNMDILSVIWVINYNITIDTRSSTIPILQLRGFKFCSIYSRVLSAWARFKHWRKICPGILLPKKHL